MRDTTVAAEQVRLAAIRAMPPAQRLRQAIELSERARAIALAAMRERHPGRSDLELVELLLGQQLIPAAARPTQG